MTASTPASCPSCGAAATGNFCAACGAPLGSQHCASCGSALPAGGRFCPKCGTPAGGATRTAATPVAVPPGGGPFARPVVPLPSRDRTAWIVAGSLIVVTVLAVAFFATRRTPPSVPSMANAGNAVPGAVDAGGGAGGAPAVRAPDISNMTPKEQYTRLVARIARAEDAGDSATIINFTPMALGAYANLPPGDRDIDARFHAALMETRVGMLDNARALTDTIMTESADNLLGYYLRAVAAGVGGDSAKARAARAAFRAHYDTELKRNRPEYAANRALLELYRKGAGAR